MAIKFSQLPKTTTIDSTSLLPVVTIGMSSNVLGAATGTTVAAFITSTMAPSLAAVNANVADMQSNASSQQTTIGSLVSGQASQGSSISIIQGQITSLQSNAAAQDAQITAVQAATFAGVVNSVLVTGPIVKSGNATYPNISIPVATSSANGYLSSTDWSTFNNKAPTANPTFTGTVTTPTIVPSSNAASNIGSPTLQYNTVHAKATSAQYADLAENYLADAVYPVGTVMMIGGEAEVTACQFGNRAIGAVSADPAYLMNSYLEGGTPVALKGRVPVRVIGTVKKGQNLIAGQNGCATAAVYHSSEVFGIALESSNDSGEKLVEAVIL
jgi:hypothetical protein